MNFYIGISLTMLAGVAGIYLLAKTKAESLGMLYKLASWFIILVSGLLIVCQLTQGCMRMCCHHRGMTVEKECRMNGSGCMMMREHCMGGGWREECKRMGCDSDDSAECCKYMKGKEGMEKCKGMMKEKEDGGKADSTKH